MNVGTYLLAAVISLATLHSWSMGEGIRPLNLMSPEWRRKSLHRALDILTGQRHADGTWVCQ